jgi:hypothetical protein
MSKGVVIHLDNDIKGILEPAKNLFDQLELELDYVICGSIEEFNSYLIATELPVKSLIFDLMSDIPGSDPDFLDQIQTSFLRYNVPVFIYSGYLESIGERFDNNGTVYKFDKATAVVEIFDKIKFYDNSGFIDVFCPGGILENEINMELNASFTNQFSKNVDLENVIKSILNSSKGTDEEKSERVKTVLKRLTFKSLSSDLLAPVAENTDSVHPIEHFYKRQSKIDFWTGDIWVNKTDNTQVIILTPRCDINKVETLNLLYCEIEKQGESINLTGKPEVVKKRLHDNITDNTLGKSKRYIPQNVFYPDGGFVNLKNHGIITKESLKIKYDYVVTLSDDFTNEIIGKFAYYFMRTGITTINEDEFKSMIESLNIV